MEIKHHTFTPAQLALMSPDTVENWYNQGCVTQDEYEAYMFVWTTWGKEHNLHFCDHGDWTPSTDTVRYLAERISENVPAR